MIRTATGLAVLEPHRDRWLSPYAAAAEDLTAADPRIRTILCPLIPRGGVVVDGGAYIGDHTVAYAETVGLGGEVFAFEPSPEAMACLLINTAHLPQVHCYAVALGQDDGAAALTLDPHNAGGTHVGIAYPEDALIPVIHLDALQFDRLDYVKLDLEGFELMALVGAQATIRQHRPILVLETGTTATRYGYTPAALAAWLTAEGYAIEPLPLERPEDRQVYDWLCRPREA